MMKYIIATGFIGLLSMQTIASEDRGLELTLLADETNSGFVDVTADLTMTLINESGDEVYRELSIQTLEGVDTGDKTKTVFSKPMDLRGTAFLSHTNKVGADDQWIYLPSIKRVKKIASKNRKSPFFGSEFSFEDLSSLEIEKYTYRYLKDEPCGEKMCHIVERYPVDEESAYSKLVVWMFSDTLQIKKIDYYDQDVLLLKTLIASDYRRYIDRFWRATLLEMTNHQSGKKTLLKWENYAFENGLKASAFSARKLSR